MRAFAKFILSRALSLLFVTFMLAAITSTSAHAIYISPDDWDPTMEGVGTNRYAYSQGDPVNKSDPNGHQSATGEETGHEDHSGMDKDGDNVPDFMDPHPKVDDSHIYSLDNPYDMRMRAMGGGLAQGIANSIDSRVNSTKGAVGNTGATSGASSGKAANSRTKTAVEEPKTKNEKNGNTTAAQRGQQAHKDWDYGPGYKRESTEVKGIRPDAVNKTEKTIKELKPDNPRAIARGQKQLENYVKQYQEQLGGVWKGILETYE